MSAAQPARVDRPVVAVPRFSLEVLGLVVLALVIGGIVAVGSWCWQNYAASPAQGMTRPAAVTIVERGSRLIGLDEPAELWTERLVSGQASVGDYLLRVFVSPAYLENQADDRTFLTDATQVITGETISAADLDRAAAELAASGSRLVMLKQILTEAGFDGTLALPAEPTSLTSIALDELPADGAETVGLLSIAANTTLTGRDARLRLFVDDRLRHSQNITDRLTIEWDTRRETAGSHELALLVQTSDGRGEWLNLNTYNVPEVTALATGYPLSAQAQPNQTSWYSLPVTEGQGLLTLVDTNQPLDLEMVDLHGKSIATTTSPGGQPAALRAALAGSAANDETCYVRVSTPTAATGDYQLVPALTAAIPDDDATRLLGVLALREGEALIQDETGSATWQSTETYKIFDTTARLSQLVLTLPGGANAQYAQNFDPADTLYGLIVDANTTWIDLSALTMEGSAAELQISVVDESGTPKALAAGDPVPLAKSENRLQLAVTGYDGSNRTYEVSILRPPHSGGYHLTLEQFPKSYRTPLWLLHIQHPAWQFEAFNTDLLWADFIAAEDLKSTSLVDADYAPASWVEPGSPVYDGDSWVAANTRVIEHFGDPRNFLDEVFVFQFEKMDFDPQIHTIDGINAIIKNSFMAVGNDQDLDYAAMLMEAGQTAGISPYFIAAKIIQEMGNAGESELAYGTLPGYEGFYNFYNIGSTPNPDVENGALINGARFAQYGRKADEQEITAEEAVWLLPWNTPQKAITGGAIWIAQRYIQIGQDTLYLQKFDLIDDGTLYTHQYAQNIQMAWSEARNTRKAYVGMGLLDEAFAFKIPVFIGMPAEPRSLP